EVDAEDPDPETGGVVPDVGASPQTERLHEEDQGGQPHGELWKEVVIDERERELEAVKHEGVRHSAGALCTPSDGPLARRDPCAATRRRLAWPPTSAQCALQHSNDTSADHHGTAARRLGDGDLAGAISTVPEASADGHDLSAARKVGKPRPVA